MAEFGAEVTKNIIKTGTAVAMAGRVVLGGVGVVESASPTPTRPPPEKVTPVPKRTEVKPPANLIKTTEVPKSPTPEPLKTRVVAETAWPTPTPISTSRPRTLEDDINEILMKNRDNKAVSVLIAVKEWLDESDFNKAIAGFASFIIFLFGAGVALVLKARSNVKNEEKAKAKKKADIDNVHKTKAPQVYNSQKKRQ